MKILARPKTYNKEIRALEEAGYEIIPPDKKKCLATGKVLSKKQGNFYKSNNRMFACDGLIPVSKKQIDIYYQEYYKKYSDARLAIFKLCQELNVVWKESAYEGAVNSGVDNHTIYKHYLKNVNSLKQYEGMSFKDSDEFNEYINKDTGEDDDDFYNKPIPKTKKKAWYRKWGQGKEAWMYYLLEDEYTKLVENFGSPKDIATLTVFEEFCKTKLDIELKRQSGQNVDREQKMLIAFMDQGNLNVDDGSGDERPLGSYIKMIEDTEPIVECAEQWKDPDNFEKWAMLFAGQLGKMFNVKTAFLEKFHKTVEKFTVKRDEDIETIDDEDGEDDD